MRKSESDTRNPLGPADAAGGNSEFPIRPASARRRKGRYDAVQDPALILDAARVGRLSDRADHFHAGGIVELLAHALARVAAPALHVGLWRPDAPAQAGQFILLHPGLGATVHLVAVIEHETRAVRVAEKFEPDNLHAAARFAAVEIVKHLPTGVEPDEIDLVCVAHRIDEADEVAVILAATRDV